MLTEEQTERLRFPVGRWKSPDTVDAASRKEYIQTITSFPALLAAETETAGETILQTTYRPGGWNVRQVVHHCADSHMNALIRFKLALTEETPTIKPYREEKWAGLADSLLPVAVSLRLMESVHARWVALLNAMQENDWQKGFVHPEHGHELKLFQSLHLYAWHCRHHLAHVQLVTKG